MFKHHARISGLFLFESRPLIETILLFCIYDDVKHQ